jgi:MOSC domain-containing protein YiiM
MTSEDTVNEALLAQYLGKLAGLRYETVGIVEALVLTPTIDEHIPMTHLRVLPESGVEGQYPGKQWWRGKRVPGRQISAINAEVLDALEVPYEVSGDNLIIRGLNLALFGPGDTLRIGDALLTVTPTPHRPCSKFARRTSLTQMKAISGGKLRGLMLDAQSPATLHVGDPVERILLTPTTFDLFASMV